MKILKNLQIASIAFLTLVGSVTLSEAAVGKDSIRVDCGGTANYTDSAGNVWVADSGFSGGQTYTATSTIAGTPDQALYKSERWESSDFSYNFNVAPGTYKVSLYESSLYAAVCNAGGRVFDVTINGTKVLTNYDMFNEVGCLTAQIKAYTVATKADGKINITFNIGTAGNPKIAAISVLYLNSTIVGIQGQSKATAANGKQSIIASQGAFSVRTQTEGAYSLELSDLQGKRIGLKQGFGTGSQTFSNLKPGVYFLNSRIGSQAFTRTISVLR
jgi:hypothetical protein